MGKFYYGAPGSLIAVFPWLVVAEVRDQVVNSVKCVQEVNVSDRLGQLVLTPVAVLVVADEDTHQSVIALFDPDLKQD